MKFEKPPDTSKIKDTEVIRDLFSKKHNAFLALSDKRYFYWDEVKYRKNLPYNNPEKAWKLLQLHRQINSKPLEIGNYRFRYFLTESIQKDLHEFDLKLIGGLFKNPITPYDKAEYLKNSILEEAIASSQIEGAATTTAIAFDMLKKERAPRDESEQMIFNNLRGISLITQQVEKELTFELIIEIHRIMTAKTSAEYCAGDFRKDQIFVQDHVDGEIAHTPPAPEEIEELMKAFCDFANSHDRFIHPIIKASILHFLFGFIHPFMDGNGRTARAIFYWYLIKKDYTLMKNISISRAILDSRIQYDKAFLKTESDSNDLTYFINYSIKSLRVAFEKLISYRNKKKNEREEAQLIAYKLIDKGLNKRQADLIGWLYAKPSRKTNIKGYSDRHDVVRQTARKDLNELINLGLIEEEKEGREIRVILVSKNIVIKYLET